MSSKKKRDKASSIKHKGIIAGLKGRSTQACPWTEQRLRASWIEGWREGHEGYIQGTPLLD